MDSTSTSMKGSFSPISDLILGMLGLAGVSFFLAKAFGLPTGFWLITFAFYLGQSVLILRHWRWRADFGTHLGTDAALG